MNDFYLNDSFSPYCWTSDSKRDGPIVGIFVGVHGDEKASVEVIDAIKKNFRPFYGIVHLVIVNPQAVDKSVRAVNKNINSCFFEGNIGIEPEDIRARQLMNLLDQCDALIDLHEHKDQSGSFIICEQPSFPIANSICADYILYNLFDVEPNATDTYMYLKGKIGICFEAGNYLHTHENKIHHLKAVEQFLSAIGAIKSQFTNRVKKASYVKVIKMVSKNTDTFKLNRDLNCFDSIDGICYASDANQNYWGSSNEIIIFPRPDKMIGESVALIGFVGK